MRIRQKVPVLQTAGQPFLDQERSGERAPLMARGMFLRGFLASPTVTPVTDVRGQIQRGWAGHASDGPISCKRKLLCQHIARMPEMIHY